jgi:hypothetical protein
LSSADNSALYISSQTHTANQIVSVCVLRARFVSSQEKCLLLGGKKGEIYVFLSSTRPPRL